MPSLLRRARLLLVALLVGGVACGDDPAAVAPLDAEVVDARPPPVVDAFVADAPPPDAAPPDAFVADAFMADACVPTAETCDGRDEDCDGVVDGPAAAVDCPLAHAEASCAAARCQVKACAPGFEDCDGEASNGCETDLRSLAACGSCGTTCAAANADMACVAGACVVDRCADGFADCDGDPRTGCEADLRLPDHCGACGSTCELANAVETCAQGSCALQACAPRFGNCDGDVGNGCETSLARLDSCGACGVPCARPHAVTSCDSGQCALVMCDAGHGNCDGQAANGCETELYTDELRCGSCNKVCGENQECLDGRCVGHFVELCTGSGHTCVLRETGEVLCWGANHYGQLGRGVANDQLRLPGPVMNLDDAVQISCGGYHTCALREDGSVSCWGRDVEGQLGSGGSGEGRQSTLPTPVMGLAGVLQVGAGHMQTCAVRAGGEVWCWGSFNGGETLPFPDAKPLPVKIDGIEAVSVSAGENHICALRGDGSVACWDNLAPWHGPGGPEVPTTIPGLAGITKVVTASRFSCALDVIGVVQCWGDNWWGQLGDGTHGNSRETPALVGLTGPAVNVSIGGNSLGCATMLDGTVQCWGKNEYAGLGDGSVEQHDTPVTVFGLVDALTAETGSNHVCALRATGGIDGWGSNGGGQLGTIYLGNFHTPTHVTLP